MLVEVRRDREPAGVRTSKNRTRTGGRLRRILGSFGERLFELCRRTMFPSTCESNATENSSQEPFGFRNESG